MSKIINLSEQIKKRKLEEKKRPAIITFLGFCGKSSCFSSINKLLASKKTIRIIDAAPKDPSLFSWWREPYSKIDSYTMQKNSLHIGLGNAKNQSTCFYKQIIDSISPETPVILCGHSQGALIAIEFFKKYNKKLNIKGIISMTPPINGVTALYNLKDKRKLKKIFNKSSSFIERNFMPFIISNIYMNLLSLFGKIFRLATVDFFKSKSLFKRRERDLKFLNNNKVPFLNIIAGCNQVGYKTSKGFSESDFLTLLNLKEKKNDNILSIEDQRFSVRWDEFKEIEIEADHGIFHLKNTYKIFDHPEALSEISTFIYKNFNL